MKFKKSILLTVLALSVLCLSLFCLTGCDDTDIYASRVKVVFKLEGGVYRSTQSDVVYYLGEKDGTSKKIYDPVVTSGEEMTNAEYKFVGWFRDRIEEGDKVVYRNKWDFELDRVGDDGITLYACWRRYTYNVCYRDDDGELQVLGEYSVDAGEPFEDYDSFDDARTGYTSLDVYRTESGEIWDENFTHPGGDEDLAVNVVVDYLKGDYKLVRTARELKASRNGNIYLMNDIDFEGEKFAGFGNYRGTLNGNGHAIKNFSIDYTSGRDGLVTNSALENDGDHNGRNLLVLSLFGNVDGAVVENVRFENVTFDVNTTFTTTAGIYVAPLALTAKNSTFENVTWNGALKVTALPNNFDRDNQLFVTTAPCYRNTDGSKFEDCTVTADNQTGK